MSSGEMEASFLEAARSIAAGLGAPQHPVTINLLASWSSCEKPPGGAWQWNNPLNTTQPYPGATCVNSVCVRNYPSRAAGITATVQTLLNGYYPTLVAGLRQADAGLFFSAPREMATWGTGYGCVRASYGPVGPSPAPNPVQPTAPAPAGAPWAVLALLGGGALLLYATTGRATSPTTLALSRA